MIEHIKNLARHSSVYTISTFIQRALGFIMLPVYTSTAYISSRSEYGDLSLVYTFIAFMTMVYLYGMDSALMRYFFLGKYERKDVYKSAFIGVLTSGIVLSAALLLFAGPLSMLVLGNGNYQNYIYIAAAILFSDSLGNLPYLILRAEEKSLTYSTVRIGRFLVELVLNIVFVVFLKYGVVGILYANLLASLFNIIILLPFQAKYLRGRFRRDAFKEMALFALPMLPNGLAYLTVEVSDKFLMRLLLDKDTVGTYSANYKFGSMLLLVVIAFRTAWQPFFLKVAGEKNAREIYAKVLTYFTLAGVIVVVSGSYFIEYIVQIPLSADKTIMGKEYWEGLFIIPVVLSAYLLYGIYVNLTVGVFIKKRTGLMIVFTGLAALVNVGSNLYLMPHYGMMGAAVATLLSYLTMALSIFIANQKIYPIRYEYGRIIVLLGYLVIMLSLFYALPLSFLWRIILVVLSPLIFFAAGFFKKEELNVLRSLSGRKEPA